MRSLPEPDGAAAYSGQLLLAGPFHRLSTTWLIRQFQPSQIELRKKTILVSMFSAEDDKHTSQDANY